MEFMSGAVEQWLRMSMRQADIDTRFVGSRIHDSLGFMNGWIHSPCSLVADILFKFTKYFEHKIFNVRFFKDSTKRKRRFFSTITLLPESPQRLVLVVLTRVLCKNSIWKECYFKNINILVSAQGQSKQTQCWNH